MNRERRIARPISNPAGRRGFPLLTAGQGRRSCQSLPGFHYLGVQISRNRFRNRPHIWKPKGVRHIVVPRLSW